MSETNETFTVELTQKEAQRLGIAIQLVQEHPLFDIVFGKDDILELARTMARLGVASGEVSIEQVEEKFAQYGQTLEG